MPPREPSLRNQLFGFFRQNRKAAPVLNNQFNLLQATKDGVLLTEETNSELNLSEETIAQLKPQSAPKVTKSYDVNSKVHNDDSSSDEKRFMPSGGFDYNANFWRAFRIDDSGRLYVKDEDLYNLLYNIRDNQTNFSQLTKLISSTNNIIDSVTLLDGSDSLQHAIGGTVFTTSAANSSTVQLAGGATFTGTIQGRNNQQAIIIALRSNTTGILTITQYSNASGASVVGTPWVYNLAAGESKTFANQLTAPFYNVTYQNTSGTTTATFDLRTVLGTLPSQTTLGNNPVSLNEVNGSPLSFGQRLPAASLPVVLPTAVQTSNVVTSPAANYNLLTGQVALSGVGTGWVYVRGYNSFQFSVSNSTGTGVIQFEQTDDPSSTVGAPWFVAPSTISPAVPVTSFALGGATGQYRHFVGDIKSDYIRVRVSSTTGGQVNSQALYRQAAASNRVMNTNEGGTLDALTKANIGFPVAVTDITGLISTTTTTARFTPTFGNSFQVQVSVAAISGAGAYMDVSIEISLDDGATYRRVWDIPRIMATGTYECPLLFMEGTRVRYVQNIGGTTPSITRTIRRIQCSITPQQMLTQLIDRTIDLNTLNSVTPWLSVKNARNVQLLLNVGTSAAAPTIQLEATDDDGTNVDLIGTAVTPTLLGGNYRMTLAADLNIQKIRAKVTGAGTTVNNGFVLLKGF